MPRRIALTPGEPSGIGPDLAIMLAQEARDYELVAIADPDLLSRRAALLGLPLELQAIDLTQTPEADTANAGTLRYQPISLAQPEQAGILNPANASYVLQTLDEAVRGCAVGDYDALVTGP
ncbi:MAG: 4-hydroxythreonine-4-phosphate dehydrogenase PdxA, partial [Gammaproteobacteria bacterium]|nr:4-hydroxythreonine-4-phosphate dehydrogenase PdxA [Gammaproteobacteria bacterium]